MARSCPWANLGDIGQGALVDLFTLTAADLAQEDGALGERRWGRFRHTWDYITHIDFIKVNTNHIHGNIKSHTANPFCQVS